MSLEQTVPLFGAVAVTAAMGLGFWMSNRGGRNKLQPLVDPEMQTRKLPDGSRVSKFVKDDDNFMTYLFEDAKTLYEAVRRGRKVSNNGPMVGYRKKMDDGTEPFVWIKYNEIIDRSIDLAKGFRSLGLPAGQETFIGLYSKNRPEWIIAEHATYTHRNVIVPLYETLGPEACAFIIQQADIKLIVCDTNEKCKGLLSHKAKCPSLSIVVLMETPTVELIELATGTDVRLIEFSQLEQVGRDTNNRGPEPTPPSPSDLATICYTSGTTGQPKGVMLTHGNVIADGTTLAFFKHSGPNTNDIMISFLPLAHMFERVLESACFTVGACVGFFRGDIRLLSDDIKELRPTLVPVVPRVLNRIYDKVMQEVNKSTLKKTLFDWAITAKERELNSSIVRNNSIWDQTVLKKVREGMGGRVRLIITGSAPLSENVLTFIRAAMGCVVVEGYGQTECVAACTVTMEGDHTPGHVGMPSPCNAVKLVDCPELNYFVNDNGGEVCVRGANVFLGYYKNEEQTREILDENGWLHTGDIGKWTKMGTLKIIDRKKNIFKLAQGEYVAPEKIENVYARSKFVAQNFVFGESLKTCLIAIVVPDFEVLQQVTAGKLNLKDVSPEALCKDERVKKMIMEDIVKLGKESGLFNFEQVKDIYLCAEQFAVDNDLLTPTLKAKRPQLKKHFAKELASMYNRLE